MIKLSFILRFITDYKIIAIFFFFRYFSDMPEESFVIEEEDLSASQQVNICHPYSYRCHILLLRHILTLKYILEINKIFWQMIYSYIIWNLINCYLYYVPIANCSEF